MTLILTLVTRGASAARLAKDAPGGLGAPVENAGKAWCVTSRIIDAKLQPDLVAWLQAEASGIQADWAITPETNRRKRLLISDMDSTIIGQECLDELADFAGLKAQVSAITERAMRGELDFASALTERVAMLKGLDLSALEVCYSERVTLNPGARALTATMKAHGARCVLVSGGFRFFTSRVAKAAGFDIDRANTLIDDGRALTGAVGQPILGREAKLAALRNEAAALGLSPADAAAIGDGANDLDMIRAAGLGIAYKAKPIVAAETLARIECTDLTAALFFQGYAESEIVAA
jgi:phosphoserine phosphatase